MKKLILLFICVLLTIVTYSQNMKPYNYVNDYEDIFTNEEESILNSMIKSYEDSTNIQIVVVTTDSVFATRYELKIFSDEFGKKWGVASSELDNRLVIVISVVSRKWAISIGCGLEPLLTDSMSVRIGEKYFTNNLRNGDYFKGVKEFLNAIMNEIGREDYKQLIEKKEDKAKQRIEVFVNVVLIILSIAIFIILIIYLIRKVIIIVRKRKYLSDNIDIIHKEILKRKEDLLKILNEIPSDIQNIYDNNVTNNKIKVDKETYNRLLFVLDKIKSFQNLIYNTNRIINEIFEEERQLKKYLETDYDYCKDYLKKELKLFLPDISTYLFTSTDFNLKRLNDLSGLNNSLNIKRQKFLKKTYTISVIVSDFKLVKSKVKEFNNLYSKYKTEKSSLIPLPIGKRLQNLAKIDIDKNILNFENEVNNSFESLKVNDYKTANYHHGLYTTTASVLLGAFSSVSNLVSSYKRGEKYVKDCKGDIQSKIDKIESKLHKSDYKSYRSELFNIKSNIKKFNNNIAFDVILAESLLKNILKDLDSLLNNIERDEEVDKSTTTTTKKK